MDAPRGDREITPSKDHAGSRWPICGLLSLAMFIATLVLFVYAWQWNNPQSKHQEYSATMAKATSGTSLVGLIFGIGGLVRKERDPDYAFSGVVLNGAWLACCGIFLLIAYAVFGGSRGSDWH